MTTDLLTRSPATTNGDKFSGGFAGSFLLHASAAALLIGWAFFAHHGQNWGQAGEAASSIQATMVPDIPLPPKAPTDSTNVLATDNPNVAPPPPAPKAVEAPRPTDILIPTKVAKPPKLADKTTPPPPPHPQPAKVDPTKATTGQAPGLSVSMSSTQTRAGTVSVGTQDAAFGTRFAYYVQQITQKVAQQWYTGMLDPQASGHRVYITFQVERDGSLSHIVVAQRSGDNTLDQTALSAVQHIDTFPPLPDAYAGSHINVTYYFDPPPHQ